MLSVSMREHQHLLCFSVVSNKSFPLALPPLDVPLLSVGLEVGPAFTRENSAEVDVEDTSVPVLADAWRPDLVVVRLAGQNDGLGDGPVAVVRKGALEDLLDRESVIRVISQKI